MPKTIRRRKSRKATGRWAPLILELRRRMYGVYADKRPVMSQQEFGKIFHVSSITVSRWENGVQDPPARTLDHLALAASGSSAIGFSSHNLEAALAAGGVAWKGRDQTIEKKDRAIISLFASLMRWKWLVAPGHDHDQDRYDEIHRVARLVFDTARSIVLAARSSKVAGPGRNLLVEEMSRLLEEIHNEEHSLWGPTIRKHPDKPLVRRITRDMYSHPKEPK